MKPLKILEWTMGWPWPIIIVLGALLVWGISRVTTWEEQESEETLM